MATFKVVVQKKRSDGLYPVYIRVYHNRSRCFIKTDKVVNDRGLTKSRDIKDPYVLEACMQRITTYIEKLNKVDSTFWDAKRIVGFLLSGEEELSFSYYARRHYAKIFNAGQERNAKNYKLAYKNLELFAGTNDVKFSDLTSTFLARWIESLSNTARAKEMYPVCVRQIYRAALLEYNDYEKGDIRIKTNPWLKVKIPEADKPKKRAIAPEACRAFFSAPLPETKMLSPLPELGRDVAMMVLCLAGINTVDLYELRKAEYYNGILHYKRRKTMRGRRDEAYIEMRVPVILQPVVDKYLNTTDDDHLFNFYQRFSSSDSFSANINIGIKKICASLGLPKEEWYCGYSFRHTWGTVAQNDCGASISEVAFAMNHSQGLTVTRGYLKIDFSPAWELNEKVVDFIFFSNESGRREEEVEDNTLRLSPKYLVRGEMFFRGRLLKSIEDIGFNNKEEVIAELAKFIPGNVPDRAMILFRIENKDKGQVGVYERMRGKSV